MSCSSRLGQFNISFLVAQDRTEIPNPRQRGLCCCVVVGGGKMRRCISFASSAHPTTTVECFRHHGQHNIHLKRDASSSMSRAQLSSIIIGKGGTTMMNNLPQPKYLLCSCYSCCGVCLGVCCCQQEEPYQVKITMRRSTSEPSRIHPNSNTRFTKITKVLQSIWIYTSIITRRRSNNNNQTRSLTVPW